MRLTFVRALALVAVAIPCPTARAECGGNCYEPFQEVLAPRSTRIAADGVLAFFIDFGRAESALAHATVTVRDAGGATIDGTLTVNADFSLLLWRPTAPWIAGDHTVVTRLDAVAWAVAVEGNAGGGCIPEDHTFEFVVEADPLPAPTAPTVLVETEYVVSEDDSLAALVCCDGAMPTWGASYDPGICPPPRTNWFDGACEPMHDVATR
jgi:hypothetical protein